MGMSDRFEYCREMTWQIVQDTGGHVRVNATTQAFYGPDNKVYLLTVHPTEYNSLGEAYDRLTDPSTMR